MTSRSERDPAVAGARQSALPPDAAEAKARETERAACDQNFRHRWFTRGGERRYTCGECPADAVGVLDRALAALRAVEEERDARFKAHTTAVGQFLNDLYATMIDPCAEGTIKVEEMCRQLLEQAVADREALAEVASLRAQLAASQEEGERLREDITAILNEPLKASKLEDADYLRGRILQIARKLRAALASRSAAGATPPTPPEGQP